MEPILFNSYTYEWAWLSNFAPYPVGDFPTAEHAYQAAKTKDTREQEWIKTAATPKEAKARSYKITKRDDWSQIKVRVMSRALRRKFQHPYLKSLLLTTYPRPLVHLSPWDTYWGVDNSGNGQNVLGKLLEELREEIRDGQA